jgi:hypothetical protein
MGEWTSETYSRRAAAWQQRALLLSEDDATRDICISIATDYESMARTLEEQERREVAKPAPHP